MSSEISEHVTITTTENSVGITFAGFGTQAIVSCNATFPERSRSYSDLPEMVDDGFTSKTPEYRAAQKAFAQKPRPKTVKIIKALGKPTLKYKIDVLAVTNTFAYVVKMKGATIADTTCTYTSDGSATNDEIVNGLLALINAIASKNFTAASVGAGGSLDLEITGNAAGDWFSVEIVDLSALMIECTHAEPATTIATDLDAVQNYDSDWYGFTYLYPSDACVKAAAAWAETQTKIYVQAMSDSTIATAADGGGDTASDLKALAYARTAIMYHPDPASFTSSAWMGRVLPTEPGKATWKFKNLKGVAGATLSTTQRTNLRAKNANGYTVVGARATTWEGKTVDGDFIDVTRNIDWLDDRMQKRVYNALEANDIVPFTDEGIQIIRNEMEATLDEAVERKILVGGDESPVITVPKAAEVDEADRGNRNLPDMNWSGRLAGAVHKVQVNGNVTV